MRKNSEKYTMTKDMGLKNGKKGQIDYGYNATPSLAKSPNQDEQKIKTVELEKISKE